MLREIAAGNPKISFTLTGGSCVGVTGAIDAADGKRRGGESVCMKRQSAVMCRCQIEEGVGQREIAEKQARTKVRQAKLTLIVRYQNVDTTKNEAEK